MSDDFFPRARARRVEGGIRARSARGAIGESWWSKRFLGVLESFALGSRLTRGKNYARAGQVISLDVTPGEVRATVQGSRPTPYVVRIGLAAFPAEAWWAVEAALAEQALFSARLLAGELPAEIEDVFTAAGIPLFPGALRDLAMACNCPDHAVPCKHLAATFYLLAEAFDTDPFQILHWRGRSREALLDNLRTLRDGPAGASFEVAPRPRRRATKRAVPAPAERRDDGAAIGAAAALADLTIPVQEDAADRFWLSPVPLEGRPAPVLAVDPDLLLRQLPAPGAALGGESLLDRLRPVYDTFGPAAR